MQPAAKATPAAQSRLTRLTIILVAAIALLGGAAAEAETIELGSGAMVRGQILRKKADRIVVDIGFKVLEIPIDEIKEILEDETDTARDERQIDLYRISPGQDELTVKENMARCAEAVVQVRTPVGLGSGFVIHPGGYVVTNNHVVAGEHEISVTLFRKSENTLENVRFDKIRIVALSPHLDLALLKIEDPGNHQLATVPLLGSPDLRQGENVFAVGSPLGLDRSVSEGIISLTNRVIRGRIFVQTTTEINPGNSGGPLFNLRGEVIGVNDLKLVGIGVDGLNFAIPASALREFLHHRDAFAFDPRNPNAGFRYNQPPRSSDDGGADTGAKQ